MKTLSIFLAMALLLLSSCATSEMTSKRTSADGIVTQYTVKVNSLGQDFKGSDLSATLDPEGKTTIKAGAVDNTTSQVTADVAASMVEMLKLMLPYMAVPVAP